VKNLKYEYENEVVLEDIESILEALYNFPGMPIYDDTTNHWFMACPFCHEIDEANHEGDVVHNLGCIVYKAIMILGIPVEEDESHVIDGNR
jgi:hypothetical protein